MKGTTDTRIVVYFGRLERPPSWLVIRFDRADFHAAMRTVAHKFVQGQLTETEAQSIQYRMTEAMVGG